MFAIGHGGVEIGVADGHDFQVRSEDEIEAGKRLEESTEMKMHLLDAFALGDVTNGAGDEDALLRAVRAEADLYRELRAVLAACEELESGAHGANVRVAKEIRAMTNMLLTKALRDKDVDPMAQQFFAAIAKQVFCLDVNEDDVPSLIDDDHGVGAFI